MDVEDLGTGEYRLSYTPMQSGVYSVTVTVNGAPVHKDLGLTAVTDSVFENQVINSPFALLVADGETVAQRSVAVGSGLSVAEAGIPTGFTVQARDINSNDRTVDLDTVTMVAAHTTHGKLGARDDSIVEVTGTPLGNGLYDFPYTATLAGDYTLSVRINGDHVTNSPFALHVSPTVAFGQLCVATGTEAGVTNGTSSFTISAHDRFDNQLVVGGNQFVVRVTGPGVVSAIPMITRGVVTDNNDGSYTAAYRVDRTGENSIEVLFADNRQHGLTARYFANQWLQGDADVERVDEQVDFEWQRPSGDSPGALLPTGAGGVVFGSVEWTGFVQTPLAE